VGALYVVGVPVWRGVGQSLRKRRPPSGWQGRRKRAKQSVPAGLIEAIIRNDAEVLAMWREAMTPESHRPNGTHNNVMTSQQGNTRAYTVSRLKRDRSDLFELVKNGKLSANAAATARKLHNLFARIE
jgi:hypothetical protein